MRVELSEAVNTVEGWIGEINGRFVGIHTLCLTALPPWLELQDGCDARDMARWQVKLVFRVEGVLFDSIRKLDILFIVGIRTLD